jgi:hypothetical protein
MYTTGLDSQSTPNTDMIIDDLIDLTEEHKRTLMYHGSTSNFLRSIIAQGMQPDPKKKVWDQDVHTGQNQSSRASLTGSYWTTNVMTAVSSATNAKKKLGGNIIIVMAEIVERSAYADEDSIRYTADGAWGQMAKNVFGVVPDAISTLAFGWFGVWQGESMRPKMIESFSKALHEALSIDPDQHPLDYNLMSSLMYAMLMRLLSYVWRDYQTNTVKYMNPFYNWPERDQKEVAALIPPPEKAEHDYLAMMDRMGRAYRKSALTSHTGKAFYTARVPTPVGFSGANRIVCIVELIPSGDPKDYSYGKIKVRYGSIPNDFREQWLERVGRDSFNVQESTLPA